MTDTGTVNRWREEGHAIAAALDAHGAAAVIGRDPVAAAEVALGIAEVQARRRRVAVADLAGEVAPLQSLVPDDLVHGVVDSFIHGVSLNRIAHSVDRAGNLFILPTGAGPIDYPTLLRDDRWRRLANGFRETGALLLAVVPEDAPGIDALALELGAVVTVDQVSVPSVATVIAHAGMPAVPGETTDPAPSRRSRRPSPPDPADVLRRKAAPAGRAGEKAGIGFWLAIAAGLLLGVAVALGWANRARLGWASDAAGPEVQPASLAAPVASRFGDVANPGDSARASAFVVVIANLTDSAAARRRILESLATLPAPTFSPDTPWFRVSVGAFESEAAADSLLRALRVDRVLEPESGYLLRAPYSLYLTTVPDSVAVRDSIAALLSRGVPAFALRESDTTVAVYAGAYETPAQAANALAVHQLAVPGAVVAYRVGRAF